MAVPKLQTAWDVLAKIALLAIQKRFQAIEVGSTRLENDRFAGDFLEHMIWNLVPNNEMAVPKPKNGLGPPRKNGALQ